MKKYYIILLSILLISGCQNLNKVAGNESKMVEEAPRFIGELQKNKLDSYATRVSNLQHSKRTYEYFINEDFYGNGRPVQVMPGEHFKGFSVKLKEGQKLLVELGKWNFNGSAIKTLESRTVTKGSDTKVKIPEGAEKFYFYRLALIDTNDKILKENYFPLYTPSKENHMIATASKTVYKKGEIASIYYENWGMNELQTGSGYVIYQKVESGWARVNKDAAFTAELIILQPFAFQLEHIDLGGLSRGNYKVLKGFSTNPDKKESENFQLGVEFTIE